MGDKLDEILLDLSKSKVIIAAASNDGKRGLDTVCWPAVKDSVLGIGAIEDLNNITEFSARGEGVNFTFPGKNIVSTSRPPNNKGELGKIWNKGKMLSAVEWENNWWVQASGTSFAAPHCAAAVAIVLAFIHLNLGKEARVKAARTDNMKTLLKSVATQQHDPREG